MRRFKVDLDLTSNRHRNMLNNMMGKKQRYIQQRRTNRRLNKTGIQLVMDINKMKSKWRKVYNVNMLRMNEKNILWDIMHNKTLRNRYIN